MYRHQDFLYVPDYTTITLSYSTCDVMFESPHLRDIFWLRGFTKVLGRANIIPITYLDVPGS